MQHIYLTEMSLKELSEGQDIFEEDIVIHAPETYELCIIRVPEKCRNQCGNDEQD
jgi:hypothetical protein